MTSKDASDHLDPYPVPRLEPHPIGELVRGTKSAKAALGASVALSIGSAWFRSDSDLLLPRILLIFVACALTAGGVVLCNLRYLAKLSRPAAIAAEKAALAAIFLAFLAVINALLGGTVYSTLS